MKKFIILLSILFSLSSIARPKIELSATYLNNYEQAKIENLVLAGLKIGGTYKYITNSNLIIQNDTNLNLGVGDMITIYNAKNINDIIFYGEISADVRLGYKINNNLEITFGIKSGVGSMYLGKYDKTNTSSTKNAHIYFPLEAVVGFKAGLFTINIDAGANLYKYVLHLKKYNNTTFSEENLAAVPRVGLALGLEF